MGDVTVMLQFHVPCCSGERERSGSWFSLTTHAESRGARSAAGQDGRYDRSSLRLHSEVTFSSSLWILVKGAPRPGFEFCIDAVRGQKGRPNTFAKSGDHSTAKSCVLSHSAVVVEDSTLP